MQGCALERRTVPDEVRVGYGYQLDALSMPYRRGVCSINFVYVCRMACLLYSLLLNCPLPLLLVHGTFKTAPCLGLYAQ